MVEPPPENSAYVHKQRRRSRCTPTTVPLFSAREEGVVFANGMNVWGRELGISPSCVQKKALSSLRRPSPCSAKVRQKWQRSRYSLKVSRGLARGHLKPRNIHNGTTNPTLLLAHPAPSSNTSRAATSTLPPNHHTRSPGRCWRPTHCRCRRREGTGLCHPPGLR